MTSAVSWSEIFQSVEIVWLTWAFSLALLLSLATDRRQRQVRKGTWKTFWEEDAGAAYTLSYVFSFPIVMLLVCVVIETSLVLVVKTGTMYAAFAAARSAAVWLPADPKLADHKIRLAAIHAMVPFSEGNPIHTSRLGAPAGGTGLGAAYYKAYSKYGGDRAKAPPEYLAKKLAFAVRATEVTWSPRRPVENEDINVTVRYKMPLHIPGAARVLGHSDGVYPITSQATLQNEGPKGEATFDSERRRLPLGIDYRPLP